MSGSMKIVAIWMFLVAATIFFWFLWPEHKSMTDDWRVLATILTIVVSTIKIRFVGLWFMELRDAVLPLRLAFELYALGVGAMMIFLYM
ncbi:hypothetical protein E4T66_17080 [Sinimarinibacterium sp. CAU 1509]|uniref:hypothetical protein n=1 Tax=Sinimarinibacterium sp. CAU 1509 TaxID=2562283 RepID=UPI0010AC87C7|nr:hypothetical protein [Sinimarinibacterium sp. CAU 1509]TJY58398.1 hypothetical protein E4T66_17080 [Sinimarinibacterium sp. CAU 1509]